MKGAGEEMRDERREEGEEKPHRRSELLLEGRLRWVGSPSTRWSMLGQWGHWLPSTKSVSTPCSIPHRGLCVQSIGKRPLLIDQLMLIKCFKDKRPTDMLTNIHYCC